MPSVMFREASCGQLTLYIAKKDLELAVAAIEFDEPTRWGGAVSLTDGSRYYVEPLDGKPRLPLTLRARRA